MRGWLAMAAGMMLASETAAAQEALPVDVELVLAVDVSGSMDMDERELQRQGYVQALTSRAVLDAIRSGPYRRVAIAYVEWGGANSQHVVAPWRVVEDEASAAVLAAEIAAAPSPRIRGTSISGALAFSLGLFGESGFVGERRVIDISGDGPNNMGAPVVPTRDAVLAEGVIINGLPIMLKQAGGPWSIEDLDIYYEDCVIGGPGAFVLPVREPERMAEAIRQKLVLEIAGRPAAPPGVIPVQARAPRVDCMIGERLRGTWMRDP